MNHHILGICLSSLVISTAPGMVTAQPDDLRAAAAEKIAMSAIDASQKPDWQRYAELVHPDALREFRGIIAPLIEAAQKKDREEQAGLLAYFDGASDLKTILTWKPKEFFVRFMKKADPPALLDKGFTTTAEVLGTILEGPDQAHVVVRILHRRQNVESSKIAVVTLRQSGVLWKVMPGEWQELAESIDRGMSGLGVERSIAGKRRAVAPVR